MSEKKNSQDEQPVVLPPQYYPYCPPQEDEIDLRELWETLMRRKRTVIWTTLLIFFAAMIYLWTAKPIYKGGATLEIGSALIQTGQGDVNIVEIDDGYALQEIVKTKFGVAANTPKRTRNILNLSMQGPDTEAIRKQLDTAVQYIFQRENERLKTLGLKNDAKVFPTHLVKEINVDTKPIKPKKKLILVVSIVTGLILGIFLAFFLEFIGKDPENTK